MPNCKFRITHPKKHYNKIVPNSGVFEFHSIVAMKPKALKPPIGMTICCSCHSLMRQLSRSSSKQKRSNGRI